MMNLLIEQLADDPKGTAIGLVSALAIVGGIGIGISRGAFNPDPLQQKLEAKQQNHALQKQSIALANDRFDAGCEGVFYMKPGSSTYQPLTEGSGVISGEFWSRWNKAKVKPKPNITDYLPAGTTVCDAYGNVGILAKLDRPYAVVTDLLNTPDRNRITKMMSRYPSANRPQVGS
jgi:hypothetical protein